MADERRYGDREVALILKRAAELQAREGDARRLSLAELEEVAGELGMSTALVRRAAAEVARQGSDRRALVWLGAKTDVVFEAVIEGTVDDATLDAMVEVLRRLVGDPGTIDEDGSARIWSPRESSRRVFFTVVDRGDRTTLRLEERMPVDARVTVGGSAFAGGFGGFLAVIPLKVLVGKAAAVVAMGPLAVVGGTAGWLIGRALWKRRSRHREGDLQQAFADIVELAAR